MNFLNKTLKTLKSKGKDKEQEADQKVSRVEIDYRKDDAADAVKDEQSKIKDKTKEEPQKNLKKEPKRESKKELKENTKDAYKILIKPLISEKAAKAGKLNQYIFIVNKRANKPEVKKAIEAVYGIKPIKVNIVNMQGKWVSFGRSYGKRKDWKKAIITLSKGKSIQIYEGT